MAEETKNPCTVPGSQCEDHFVTQKRLNFIAIWVFGIALSLMGTSIAWALATSTSMATAAEVNSRQTEDIKVLQTEWNSIESKLDALLAQSRETNQVLKGRIQPTP